MKPYVSLLMILGSLSMAWADDAPPKPCDETLGLDKSKIEPPNPEKGEPVARLFYDYIYPADLRAADHDLNDKEARRLTGLIFGELRQRYIKQKKITATSEEARQYLAALDLLPSTDDNGSEKDKEEQKQAWETIGKKTVKGWKFDRALYKKYGGTVIFQQANPLEPVGAYRRFLEKFEKAKVFEVYHEDNRTKFWHYFTRKHPFEVPPERVNFDKPWWLQQQQK